MYEIDADGKAIVPDVVKPKMPKKSTKKIE